MRVRLGLLAVAGMLLLALAAIIVIDPLPEQRLSLGPDLLVLADGFEDGAFGAWTELVRTGDASAAVSAAEHVSGQCAGWFRVSREGTSRAYIRKSFDWPASHVVASGSFLVHAEGIPGSNVPLLRVWDESKRTVDVFRRNGDGRLWLRTADGAGGYSYVNLRRRLELDRWYALELTVRPAAAESSIAVRLDGDLLYLTNDHFVPARSLASVTLGSEHVGQEMELFFDDVVMRARPPSTVAGLARARLFDSSGSSAPPGARPRPAACPRQRNPGA